MPPNDDADPYIGPASKKIAKKLAVDRFLERRASLEFRLLGCGDLDRFAGARIASGGCRTMSHGESTKTDNTNFVSTLQGTFDASKYGVDSTPGVGLCQARRVSNRSNEIVFVHGYPQYVD